MSLFARLTLPLAVLALGATFVALPGGCKRAGPTEPTTVRGAVTFQGKALAGGLVIFSPDAERGGSGKPVCGELGPDGRYQLTLANSPAISPGWYRVAIVALPTPASTPLLDQPVFPPRLARPDLSGLVREVEAGKENVFEFAVEVSGV
jgi:hypothetical protein